MSLPEFPGQRPVLSAERLRRDTEKKLQETTSKLWHLINKHVATDQYKLPSNTNHSDIILRSGFLVEYLKLEVSKLRGEFGKMASEFNEKRTKFTSKIDKLEEELLANETQHEKLTDWVENKLAVNVDVDDLDNLETIIGDINLKLNNVSVDLENKIRVKIRKIGIEDDKKKEIIKMEKVSEELSIKMEINEKEVITQEEEYDRFEEIWGKWEKLAEKHIRNLRKDLKFLDEKEKDDKQAKKKKKGDKEIKRQTGKKRRRKRFKGITGLGVIVEGGEKHTKRPSRRSTPPAMRGSPPPQLPQLPQPPQLPQQWQQWQQQQPPQPPQPPQLPQQQQRHQPPQLPQQQQRHQQQPFGFRISRTEEEQSALDEEIV